MSGFTADLNWYLVNVVDFFVEPLLALRVAEVAEQEPPEAVGRVDVLVVLVRRSQRLAELLEVNAKSTQTNFWNWNVSVLLKQNRMRERKFSELFLFVKKDMGFSIFIEMFLKSLLKGSCLNSHSPKPPPAPPYSYIIVTNWHFFECWAMRCFMKNNFELKLIFILNVKWRIIAILIDFPLTCLMNSDLSSLQTSRSW